ncbi:flagellar motor switch protein FliG [Oceaniglobus ichthyenteri]|uniref:flagellar motor switch protein FliG n=1 Tax=Oceaniglobus ichthyenteri TaxID=2136177 RepID=UPI001F0C5880|nr:FliG C-terminal domain-containing protein [Oceaniglobus ichthyenteri]
MTTELTLPNSRSGVPASASVRPTGGRLTGIRTGPSLSRRQKAAIVVRLLLAEGASLPLADLPEPLQAELTTQMSQMRYVDRATLKSVIEEFANELDSIGLVFPGGLEGALSILGGVISADMAARLRKQAGMVWFNDPWESLASFEIDQLLPLLKRQSPEVGAVLLSKLKVAKAAEILGKLPGEKARRLTFAMSETADVDPDTVRRIGLSLAAELKAEPPRAFTTGAVARVGAILNVSASATRDEVLNGLSEDDAAFADEVRRAIFTFADIPDRIQPLDVPAVLRNVPQESLVIIVASVSSDTKDAVEFLLQNMSKRLAATLRDEAEEMGPIKTKVAEAAQTEVITAIRALVDSGEIQLVLAEEDE